MTQNTDHEVIKAQHREDWDGAASRWRKYDESLRDALEPLTHRLLELAGIQLGQRVLDIGSGTANPPFPQLNLQGPPALCYSQTSRRRCLPSHARKPTHRA